MKQSKLYILLACFFGLSSIAFTSCKDDDNDKPEGTLVATPQFSETRISGNSIQVKWSRVDFAISYSVELSADNFASVVASATTKVFDYTFTDLAWNTTYKARVKANARSESYSSDYMVSSVITTGLPDAIDSPEKKTLDVIDGTSAYAEWTAPSGATGYTVQLASDKDYTNILTTEETVTTSFTFTGLKMGSTYYVRVKANGQTPYPSSPYTDFGKIYIDYVLIATPSLTATVNADYSVYAEWAAIEGAVGYTVDISSNNFASVIESKNTEDLNCSFTGLNQGTYKIRVKANASVTASSSQYSNPAEVTITFAVGIITSADTDVTKNSITVKWKDENVTRILLKTNNQTVKDITSGINNTGKSYSISSLSASTQYEVYLYVDGILKGYKQFTTQADEGGSGGENMTWNFSDLAAGLSITSTMDMNGLSIIATSTAAINVEENVKRIDEYEFGNRLKLNGTGSTTSRCVSFDITGPATITIYSQSGSSGADRKLAVSDGTNEIGTVDALGTDISKGSVNYTGGAGKIYIYSKSSGINLYLVKVEY